MRNCFFRSVLVILGALSVNLAWGQANLPNNPNAATVQGPDPTGMLGYPLATVPATGALPWPVAVQSFAASLAVTQGTSPWVMNGSQSSASDTWTSATPVNTSVSISTSGMGSVATRITTTGAITGAVLVYEGSVDGGAAWNLISIQNSDGDHEQSDFAFFNSPFNSIFQTTVAGLTNFRVRLFFAPGGAGTISVLVQASTASYSWKQPVTIPVSAAVAGGRVNLPGQGLYGLKVPNNDSFQIATIQAQTPPEPTNAIQCLQVASFPYVKDYSSSNTNQPYSLLRSPSRFKTVATAAAGNTALWTPAAGRTFRLMRWRYTITGSATTAGGADILVKLFDGAAGGTGQQDTVTVPAAATTLQGQLAASPWIDLGNGYLSSAANNVLNINLSAALSAGTVTVEAVGTEE